VDGFQPGGQGIDPRGQALLLDHGWALGPDQVAQLTGAGVGLAGEPLDGQRPGRAGPGQGDRQVGQPVGQGPAGRLGGGGPGHGGQGAGAPVPGASKDCQQDRAERGEGEGEGGSTWAGGHARPVYPNQSEQNAGIENFDT
jgi:translation initiation factor IF-2